MTPRKEIFTKVKQALMTIEELELIDLHRDQFNPEGDHPQYFTACLIKIPAITWETMVEHRQEGTSTFEVYFYCKDGWMDQHQRTSDPEGGLIEIDLIDEIADALQFLKGELFKPLQQSGDGEVSTGIHGLMAYRLSFTTRVYKLVKPKYELKKIIIS